MVDRILIDTLNLQAKDFAVNWKNLIRKAPQLKRHNEMDDIWIVESISPIFPVLSHTLDRGLDRAVVGEFFVTLGKERMNEGFPISELIFAVNLAEQTVISYLMTDFVLDSPVRMYQAMGAVNRVAEFFLLGCFYLTKGFLEATYTGMNKLDSVSEELLKKYFKDDFFFKKD
jgi:hypothetical protein